MSGSKWCEMAMNKYSLLVLSAVLLAGCENGEVEESATSQRLPLLVEASLSTPTALTRASGTVFETDDELLGYIRHVYGESESYTEVMHQLVTFTKGSETMDASTVTSTSDFSSNVALYWDDFSDSSADDTDLRTDNHALQLYYGYCYNGGTPSTALVEETGVLGWTTLSDQSTAAVLKQSDLLWAPSQTPVTYSHARDAQGTLSMPFTHAMSMFTLVVTIGDGFEAGDLASATVTLKNISQVGTFVAPTGEVTCSGTTDVLMYSDATDAATATTRTYQAITVPGSSLVADTVLACLTGVDGNDYNLPITEAMLATGAWQGGLSATNCTQSGYNYQLTVTVSKVGIQVEASLADWITVSATGEGEINFSADVTSVDVTNAALNDGDSFSLWTATQTSDSLTATALGSVATTATYQASTGAFVNAPAIYWPNGSDCLYFRALAEQTDDHVLLAVTSTTVQQGTDLLWGTTAAHTGTEADGTTTHTYAEGDAINPRTGVVPLAFSHVMSGVSFTLATSTGADSVSLTGATVTLTYLYTQASVNLVSGEVTPAGSQVASAVEATTSFDALSMVPQTLTEASKLVITLADGTTYSLQLNQCTDSSEAAVTAWTSGKQYNYTITLNKEAIQLRVLVKDWTTSTGSGTATLDWD